ncbi:MAG: indole-3-glycerol phosphate synthase TrpC [Planctomycetota bacterium]
MPKGLLDRIIAAKHREVASARERRPLEALRAEAGRAPRDFCGALRRTDPKAPLRVIAEMKKASPSAGLLREDYRPADIAREYRRCGAAALSVLTDAEFFRGTLDDLAAVARETDIPVLRKDFVVDPYQVFEARAAGADAVLLIARVLGGKLRECLDAARACGVVAMVEIHAENELDTGLDAGAEVIGINHRNLDTLAMDLGLSERLRPRIPAGIVVVAESGISRPEDVRRVRAAGVDAVLVGEALMKASDPAGVFRMLQEEIP